MRRLVLLRHAHAEAHHPEGDKKRHLSPVGLQQAQEAGVELAKFGIDYALVSAATRTRETFSALSLGVPAEFQNALYGCGTDTMLQRISEMTDDVNCLLVVAHAPAIPALTARLMYRANPQAADAAVCHFSTASYSVFSFDDEWDQFDPDFVDDIEFVSEGPQHTSC
ncbi:MAG: phosphoglycerate mutase [Arachnia propionica]|nr:MAG: phosphoglycerate mutase [Arachnia propionica]